MILLAAGFLGRIISAFVGTEENTIIFMVMVLLFRVSEKIVTPTTVNLMAMVTVAGFLWHPTVMRDFGALTMQHWLAACRSWLSVRHWARCSCSYIRREAMAGGTLLLCGASTWMMSQSTCYLPRRAEAAGDGTAHGELDLTVSSDAMR